MKNFSQSLERRILNVIMMTCFLSLILTSTLFGVYELKNFLDDYKSDLRILSKVIEEPLVAAVRREDVASAERKLNLLHAIPGIQAVYLFDAQKNLFSSKIFDSSFSDLHPALHNIHEKNWPQLCVVLPLENDINLVIYTTLNTALIVPYHFFVQMLITLGCSLFLAYILSRALSRRVFVPINSLVHAARHISVRHDYNVRVDEASDVDEVTVLMKVFNKMLAEVQSHSKEIGNIKNYLEDIIASMPSAFFCVDIDGSIVYINSKARGMTECGGLYTIGTGMFENFHFLAAHKKDVLKAISESRVYQYDRIKVSSNDATVFYKLVVYPLSHGMGAAVQLEDISMQIQMEARMIQNEKMLSISGLAAGMAHEINNPLGGMVQTVQNIERRLQKDLAANQKIAEKYNFSLDQLDHYLEEREIWGFLKSVRELGHRIANIINTMLQFSHPEYSKKTTHLASGIVKNAIALAKNDLALSGVHIDTIFSQDDVKILCVPSEIEQVLLNIIRNSAQAMKTANIHEPRITILVKTDRESLILSIEDNGPGMSDEIRQHIFEPFFTTKGAGQGTGLGLALSHYIIQKRHQGTLEVVSPAGKGAKFTISLPVGPIV